MINAQEARTLTSEQISNSVFRFTHVLDERITRIAKRGDSSFDMWVFLARRFTPRRLPTPSQKDDIVKHYVALGFQVTEHDFDSIALTRQHTTLSW